MVTYVTTFMTAIVVRKTKEVPEIFILIQQLTYSVGCYVEQVKV